MRVLVVIPARNESATIGEVVVRSLAYADVSVTDDASTDEMPSLLSEIKAKADRGEFAHRLHVIAHEKSTHIPAAVQDGLKYGVAAGYDAIITMDAGLSHDPDALPDFIQVDPSIDCVIGARRQVEGVPLHRRMISRLAALVVNYGLSKSYFDLSGPGIFDVTSGFRRYSRRAALEIARARLVSKAFDFHMEALALVTRNGMRAVEIPIKYVFTGSSFTLKVLRLGIAFGWYLIKTKKLSSQPEVVQA